MVKERPHPLTQKEEQDKYGYGMFSARYGNIYTSRQLLQLFDRAYGKYTPVEDIWSEDGRYFDPFRPQIVEGGYWCAEEYWEDRRRHFAAVLQLFQQLDVFVFTLGLTETWVRSEDGSAFPVCPGTTKGGRFDANKHVFLNLQYEEVVSDLEKFFDRLRSVNPKARIILTVSPVPLVATAEDEHVLVATTYSKSVLRAAAGILHRRYNQVMYFPSYEIITGNFNKGAYYEEDGRSVTAAGVDHVMKVFFNHYTEEGSATVEAPQPEPATGPTQSHSAEGSAALAQALCDEEMLDR